MENHLTAQPTQLSLLSRDIKRSAEGMRWLTSTSGGERGEYFGNNTAVCELGYFNALQGKCAEQGYGTWNLVWKMFVQKPVHEYFIIIDSNI